MAYTISKGLAYIITLYTINSLMKPDGNSNFTEYQGQVWFGNPGNFLLSFALGCKTGGTTENDISKCIHPVPDNDSFLKV